MEVEKEVEVWGWTVVEVVGLRQNRGWMLKRREQSRDLSQTPPSCYTAEVPSPPTSAPCQERASSAPAAVPEPRSG